VKRTAKFFKYNNSRPYKKFQAYAWGYFTRNARYNITSIIAFNEWRKTFEVRVEGMDAVETIKVNRDCSATFIYKPL